MLNPYTEDQLVEQPGIGLFAELGWSTVSALEEVFGANNPLSVGEGQGEGCAALGRETSGDVVLLTRLRSALQQLNPGLPSEAVSAAIDKLIRDRSAMSLVAANREVYQLLKEGIKVSIPD